MSHVNCSRAFNNRLCILTTGELGKLDMLHESILHQCIKQLLAKKKKAGLKEVAEDLECLTQIMKTIGKGLDNGKAKVCSLCALCPCLCCQVLMSYQCQHGRLSYVVIAGDFVW